MRIENHRLVDAPFRATPSMGGALKPELLVIHYTATRNGPGTIASLQSPALKASAHLVVDVDGSITQMVPFDRQAWHAGKSEWRGRSGCNAFSLGIEIINPGPLVPAPGGGFRDTNGHAWTGDVFAGRHRHPGCGYGYWAEYPEQQRNAVREASLLLVATYQLVDVAGHDEIAWGRKIDPGPAWDMDSFRRQVLSGEALEARCRYA